MLKNIDKWKALKSVNNNFVVVFVEKRQIIMSIL